MPRSVSDSDLHEQLARWAAQQLISSEQAARIEAAEAARAEAARSQPGAPPPAAPVPAAQAAAAAAPAPQAPGAAEPGPPPAARRLPLAVEALGYAGGILAIVGGVLAVGALWPGIPDWAALLLAAVATVALGTGGALVRAGSDPAFGRLRSLLWLLATVGLAGVGGILTSQILHFSDFASIVTTFAATTVVAAGFWWLTRTAAQELVLFASAAALTGTAIGWAVGDHNTLWASGLGVWLLSALWGVAVMRGYLGPRWAGYLAAGAGLLVGAQLTLDEAAGHVLAIATVAGLLTAGVLLRRVLVVVLGAVGMVVVIPQTATRYLPSEAGTPLSILVVALVVLGLALWLARRWTPRPH